jgi:hypothetical protein
MKAPLPNHFDRMTRLKATSEPFRTTHISGTFVVEKLRR